jgi:hypothetical protein
VADMQQKLGPQQLATDYENVSCGLACRAWAHSAARHIAVTSGQNFACLTASRSHTHLVEPCFCCANGIPMIAHLCAQQEMAHFDLQPTQHTPPSHTPHPFTSPAATPAASPAGVL